jgi:SsrA-binding protein
MRRLGEYIHICYNTHMAKNQKSSSKPAAPIVNRRARFDYELGDEIVAGLALTGLEARAARDGHIQLKGAYVTIRGNELWLNNASFSLKINERGNPGARSVDTSPRKLLVHTKQIAELSARKKEGMTIVPTKLLTQGRFIKVVIALGKGKKNYDKRETIKRRDIEREHARMMK